MILSLHSIAGAILASNSKNVGEAIFIGLISHYFFDSLPHNDYRIEKIEAGDFKTASKEFLKVFIDLLIGLSIIFYLIYSNRLEQTLLVLTGAFFAILPDGLSFLNFSVKNKEKNIFTKLLQKHYLIHGKIHSTVINKAITISSQVIIMTVLFFSVFK